MIDITLFATILAVSAAAFSLGVLQRPRRAVVSAGVPLRRVSAGAVAAPGPVCIDARGVL
jgi:hypothetical protein